ncbi:MAG: hypothetical protein CVT48_00510 [Thermoplasmata archaeon HGW-Thermoplasmata-1]|nr:MAG: hypothetical protein CVT48_00510 [Thermoplasmata archaeon HGW-Thermoplasmata-1]
MAESEVVNIGKVGALRNVLDMVPSEEAQEQQIVDNVSSEDRIYVKSVIDRLRGMSPTAKRATGAVTQTTVTRTVSRTVSHEPIVVEESLPQPAFEMEEQVEEPVAEPKPQPIEEQVISFEKIEAGPDKPVAEEQQAKPVHEIVMTLIPSVEMIEPETPWNVRVAPEPDLAEEEELEAIVVANEPETELTAECGELSAEVLPEVSQETSEVFEGFSETVPRDDDYDAVLVEDSTEFEIVGEPMEWVEVGSEELLVFEEFVEEPIEYEEPLGEWEPLEEPGAKKDPKEFWGEEEKHFPEWPKLEEEQPVEGESDTGKWPEWEDAKGKEGQTQKDKWPEWQDEQAKKTDEDNESESEHKGRIGATEQNAPIGEVKTPPKTRGSTKIKIFPPNVSDDEIHQWAQERGAQIKKKVPISVRKKEQ